MSAGQEKEQEQGAKRASVVDGSHCLTDSPLTLSRRPVLRVKY
jgi:hypothetical protein